MVDQLSINKGLRLARFYFYDAQAFFQEGDVEMAGESYTKMVENLEMALSRLPREHYTMIFLDAHAQELSQLPAELNNRMDILKALIRVDPDNANIYKRGLEVKSE